MAANTTILRARPLSSLPLATFEHRTLQEGAVFEFELAFGLQAAVGAAGVGEAQGLALVLPFAADANASVERDPVAAGDLRDFGDGLEAVAAGVHLLDLDRDDEGGRARDGQVGVREQRRVAVFGLGVEEGDRRGGRDRALFGEVDDGLAEAFADDRAGAELARLRRGR